MFTGIIEEIGIIQKMNEQQDIHQYKVHATSSFIDEIKTGDSIAVNGVCLTAYNVENNSFFVDVSTETQNRTTFNTFVSDQQVNLERSVTPETRLGGHIVSGHIDTTTSLLERTDHENESILWFSIPSELIKYIPYKGSICIDGISLTINQIEKDRCCVTIIPHTLKNTTLQNLRVGDLVNIEVDQIARYLEQLNKH